MFASDSLAVGHPAISVVLNHSELRSGSFSYVTSSVSDSDSRGATQSPEGRAPNDARSLGSALRRVASMILSRILSPYMSTSDTRIKRVFVEARCLRSGI